MRSACPDLCPVFAQEPQPQTDHKERPVSVAACVLFWAQQSAGAHGASAHPVCCRQVFGEWQVRRGGRTAGSSHVSLNLEKREDGGVNAFNTHEVRAAPRRVPWEARACAGSV